jgi:hypothetical protein
MKRSHQPYFLGTVTSKIYYPLFLIITLFILFATRSLASEKWKGDDVKTSTSVVRGTEIIYRNLVSARSFNKSADLTYNPYYAMELDVTLGFMPKKHTALSLNSSFLVELTDSDVTTKRNELEIADIYFNTSLVNLLTIPLVNIDVVPSLKIFVPSSKVSQARTLVMGLRPKLTFIKHMDALSGLDIMYAFWVEKDFHEYTTAMSEFPLIDTSFGSTRSSDSFYNLGKRNVSVAISNYLGLSLFFKKYLGARIGFVIRHGFLYPIDSSDPRISYQPQDETNVRYQMLYEGELLTRIKKIWTFSLGFLTENNQLAEDSTYQAPFFNRYTTIYFDIRLDIAEVGGVRSSKRGKK